MDKKKQHLREIKLDKLKHGQMEKGLERRVFLCVSFSSLSVLAAQTWS